MNSADVMARYGAQLMASGWANGSPPKPGPLPAGPTDPVAGLLRVAEFYCSIGMLEVADGAAACAFNRATDLHRLPDTRN